MISCRCPFVVFLLVVLLAGCTAEEFKTSVARGFKSWCRDAPNCSVHEESR